MTVKGLYTMDDNFVYVYTEDTLYTLCRNSSDWGSVRVGDRTVQGPVLDQGTFDRWKSECTKEGEFELS